MVGGYQEVMMHRIRTDDLAEAIFVDETGLARREVIQYRIVRDRKAKKDVLEFYCLQAGPGVKVIDKYGDVEHQQTIKLTDPEVRTWFEVHGKAGDILECEAAQREMLELMDEYI